MRTLMSCWCGMATLLTHRSGRLRVWADEDPAPTVFDQPDFNVDRFWHGGQQFDVKHMPRRELDTWVKLIESGRGWDGYPTPVVGIHGLVSGVVLVDPDRYLGAVRDRVGRVPPAFVRNTQMSTEKLTGVVTELERCADRGDYLLFHRLAADAIRAGFIGWFAAQGRYWPLEKRLTTRLQLARRADLADLEQRALDRAHTPATARGAQTTAHRTHRSRRRSATLTARQTRQATSDSCHEPAHAFQTLTCASIPQMRPDGNGGRLAMAPSPSSGCRGSKR
jgi:hypothetical protein